MTGHLTMFDAIEVAQIPNGPLAVAGYVDGRWPTAAELAERFPNARLLSIATSPEHDADCLDVEQGDAAPADVPGWYARQRARDIERPCIYASASVMQASIVPLIRSGAIARPLVRLWSAHYSGQHICGPRSCGGVSIDVDGCQWTNAAWGRDLDESLLLADFFGATAPAMPTFPATVPVRSWMTQGIDSLATLAAAHGVSPAIILRMTCEHGPDREFSPAVAAWLNRHFDQVTEPIPPDLELYLPA